MSLNVIKLHLDVFYLSLLHVQKEMVDILGVSELYMAPGAKRCMAQL